VFSGLWPPLKICPLVASMSFHVLFLSNEKTEHSSQVFIGKANFSRVMKKLENAGDLSGRQNVRV
jgi:hypothetical protein